MRTPSFRHSPIALCALLALGAAPALAQVAANTLPVVRPGGALINATVGTPAGNTLAITQTQSAGNRGLIEWTSFSIGSAARVTITQPNAQSLLVNRVTGNSPSASEIHGSLTANGRVLLINPAGVMFGATAQVSAGSLVASALDLDTSMTANNYAALIRGDDIELSGGYGAVTVSSANDPRQPQIQVTEGGSIVLLSQAQVGHDGVISAPRGEITLSTGGAATLRAVGTSGFVQVLQVTPGEPQSSGVTTGIGSQTLAAGGRIVIGGLPDERDDARGDNIAISGLVSTASTTGNGGSIHIDGGARGSVYVADASVTASSTTATGGQATLLGGSVTLQDGDLAPPEVIVDGATGGGRITVGDARTRAVMVNDGVLLSADATRNGNGGQISLRAMYEDSASTLPTPRIDFGVTEAYGVLRARGGTEGGNGGQIETSGMAVTTALANSGGVYKQGTIDARARAAGGTAGSWTLDPYDVTISSAAPQDVAGSFEPTGPGANVQASDIVAALNAGTSVVISTDAGGAGSQAGNISISPGTSITRTAGTGATTLTLRANNNVLVDGTIIGSTGGAGPLNLNLYADLDGNGTGGVSVVNASIATAGGSVTASGGIDPTTGYARGTGSAPGVSFTATDIDTRNLQTGTAGDITLRGRAGIQPGSPAAVQIAGNYTFGNLTIDGRASHGTAVSLAGANLDGGQADGNIDIRGIATRIDTATANLIGIDADGTRIVIGTGLATLAGRGDDANISSGGAVGLRIGDLTVVGGSSGAPGTVKLVGQSTGGSIAPGIQMLGSASTGLVFRDGDGSPANLNLVIGALSDVRATSLEIGVAGLPPQVAVDGTANIRPLGVSGTTGDLVEQAAVPISLIPRGSNFGAGTFTVSSDMLAAGGGLSAAGGVVIGSRGHTGAIVVDNNAFPAAAPPARLTLQNEGTGSAGITIGAGNTFGVLGLLTAGNVSQAAAGFSTGDLVIRGGAASTVTLDSAANQVNGVLAFDPPASLTVRTAGSLTVDAASTAAYDGTSTTPFAPVAITGSLGGTTALLRAGGNVQVNRPISMSGTSGVRLDIVSPGTVTFAAGAALSAPGGLWRIWAPTVVNAAAAGSFSNLYGCLYGDTTTCSVSGITLPATGNSLMHAAQPTITVAANPTTGVIGAALPALTYTVSGLVNGDTAAGALSGTLSATPSGTNTYAIGQGTLASPLGYNVAFTPSVLTLRRAELTRHMLMDAFNAENSSDVYGRNLDQPYVCTAASVMRGGLAEGAGADPLASEWGKVRNQPQLSGCLNVTDGGSCSAF